MQVYFDTSLWLSKKGRPCKVRQDTDAVFTEGGLTRCVPTVYCFKQGIIFDILTVVKESDMVEYFEKYKGWEKKADSLSDTQVQKIMQENPYQNSGRGDVGGSGRGGVHAVYPPPYPCQAQCLYL